MLRICVSCARGHMLDATPKMGCVGWGGVGMITFGKLLHTWWMLRNCVTCARGHVLDAMPMMGWVGWGW